MRVSLLEDIKSLGSQGSIVEVPDGYAIQFLFPQHLAVKVDAAAVAQQETTHKEMSKEAKEEQSLAGEIDALEVVVQAKTENGKLKKPVTATEVRAALKEMGYKVPKNVIKMEPLTELGSKEVTLEFPSGFDAVITLSVEAA